MKKQRPASGLPHPTRPPARAPRVRLCHGVIGAGILAGLVLVLLVVPAWRESQTSDEGVYVVAGLSYWRTGDFRLNPEHPPLLKLLLAVPLVARGATFVPPPVDWERAHKWIVSRQVLYQNVAPGPALLFSARCVNILLTLALIALVGYWAGRTVGVAGGVIATLLAAFEPNVLAMGHLATTDIGYTLALLGSVVTFLRYLEHPSRLRLGIAALTFSAALLTRFNALLLVVILPVVYLLVGFRRRWQWPLRWPAVLQTGAVFAVTAAVAIWVAYGFEVRRLTAPQDEPAHKVLAARPAVAHFLERTPVPALSYISGLLFQVDHNRTGHGAYLLGRKSVTGWWYYFPVAIAVKTTVGLLVLFGLGVGATWRATARDRAAPVFSPWEPAVVGALLLANACLSRINIGVRYVLPVILIMALLAGGVAPWLRRRGGAVFVSLLVAGSVVSVVRHFPHWLPYANELVGGPAKLDRILTDSNLDWGQDIPLVAAYMRERRITDYWFLSFSTAPAEPYGAYERDLPTDDEPAVVASFRGVIAVGKSVLEQPDVRFEWLKRRTPTAVLGHSTNVYDLR